MNAVDLLGDAEPFAKAIGLLTNSGTFNNQWLGDPGHYLGKVLSDPDQRDALLTVVEQLLGEGGGETDAQQRKWLPLFHSANPVISFFAVVDDSDASNIRIGLGVKVRSNDSKGSASLHIPLFQTSGNAIALGQADTTIDFSCEVMNSISDSTLKQAFSLDDPSVLERTNFTPELTAEQRDAWTSMWTDVKAAP